MSNSKSRSWARKRQFEYGLGFVLVWSLVGVLVYFVNYHQVPTCFDLEQNGNERGVDCGGKCIRICATDVLPPLVVWAESFEIIDGQYNAVAYVENQNQTAATPDLKYTFKLFSGDKLVTERSGATVLPPNSTYPIFEPRIRIDESEEVTHTELVLEPADLWQPASVGRDQFKVEDRELKNIDVRPRLDVVLENTKLTDAEDIEVIATIFSSNNHPVTASQTIVDEIPARSSEDLVFTWPKSIARTIESCEVPTDVVLAIDLSGSMNNDGGDPPQPVTGALKAASQFVNSLRKEDQISIVTFATNANLISNLNDYHTNTANSILGLKIDPVEETGFTNTVAALEVSKTELNSVRHNEEARRVLVLLTDGLPTAEGDKDMVALAEQAALDVTNDDIELFAIGLGQNVDQSFIKNIASDDSNAYLAPTSDDLKSIYTEITSSLCEVGPTRIDVFAKTKTNFAPLR